MTRVSTTPIAVEAINFSQNQSTHAMSSRLGPNLNKTATVCGEIFDKDEHLSLFLTSVNKYYYFIYIMSSINRESPQDTNRDLFKDDLFKVRANPKRTGCACRRHQQELEPLPLRFHECFSHPYLWMQDRHRGAQSAQSPTRQYHAWPRK